MKITAISVIFSCKQCSVSFDQVATYIEHKEKSHFQQFQEFLNTKCIVFEEIPIPNQLCHVENKYRTLPPVEMEVKIETETDSVDAFDDSIFDANSADAEAVSVDLDSNADQINSAEPELLQNRQQSANNLILVDFDADKPDGTIEPSSPCLSSQVKTELSIFEIKTEIIPPFNDGEIKMTKSEISSVVTRKTRFTFKQELQDAFPFQLETINSLPVQSTEEMKEIKFSARPRSRSKALTQVRRSTRNKFVSPSLLQIKSAAEESRLQQSSVSIANKVEITPVQQKPAEITEEVKIGSRPQKSSVKQKYQVTFTPRLLLRRVNTTNSHSSKSEKKQNKPPVGGTGTNSEGKNGRLNEKAKNKNHVCGICSKAFSWRRNLKRHSETHKTEENRTRPFKCPLCGNSFLLRYHLKDHLLRHSSQKPFKCPHAECDKAFKTKTNLISHLKSHSDIRPFKCSVRNCDKAYRQKIDLTEHIRTHTCTGERNYICTVHPCKKGFLSNYQLKRHFLRVHAEKKLKRCPSACEKA